jgi:hypothetical protein
MLGSYQYLLSYRSVPALLIAAAHTFSGHCLGFRYVSFPTSNRSDRTSLQTRTHTENKDYKLSIENILFRLGKATSKTSSTKKLILVGVLGAIVFFGIQSLMGVSADQMRRAELSCIRWFKEKSDLGGRDSFSSDTWEKDGRAVVEVGYDKNGRSYSTRLCVYDFENNTMSAPNNFNRDRWEK